MPIPGDCRRLKYQPMGESVAPILAIEEFLASSTLVTWIWGHGRSLLRRSAGVAATLVDNKRLLIVLDRSVSRLDLGEA